MYPLTLSPQSTSPPDNTAAAIESSQPVFVDITGRRGRWVTIFGVALALVLLAFLAAILTAFLPTGPPPGGTLPPAAGSGQPQYKAPPLAVRG